MVVLVLVVCIFLSLKIAYETLSSYWLTPRRIKKIMEKQGVRGPKPRFLVGNILDMASFVSKSTKNDMDSIHHDIVGRLLPHYVAWSKIYGNINFTPSYSYCMCASNSEKYIYYNRKKIHLLEWNRAENVLNGSRINQRAFLQIQHCFWEIMATTTRFQTFHRPWSFDG